MAKTPPQAPSDALPEQMPNVPPPVDLYPTSDIRFVMVELGKITTKVDRLISDTHEGSEKITNLGKKISNFETAAKVIGGALAVAAIVFWWAFGDYMKILVKDGLRSALIESSDTNTKVPTGEKTH